MSDANLLLFVTASLALIVVPGPDMLYVLARGVSQGRPAELVSRPACARESWCTPPSPP